MMSANTTKLTDVAVTDNDLMIAVSDSFGDVEYVTPYTLINVLNGLTGRNLPTQMAYNYVKKGTIPSTLNEVGKKVVAKNDAIDFITKYITKNAS